MNAYLTAAFSTLLLAIAVVLFANTISLELARRILM